MIDGFHPKDIERVKTSNIWLQRFLEQQDRDMKASLKMLWETCEWRKNFGTNGKKIEIHRKLATHTTTYFIFHTNRYMP